MVKGKKIKFSGSIFSKIFDPGRIFIGLGFLLVFFIAVRPPTDPDMGWHLANGEYLFEHNMQVARSDIYSYTMPDFPLIMHEWLTDAAMFFVSEKAGLFILSLCFAVISTSAFILASFGVDAKKEYKIIAAILAIIASIPILGVRPQMINMLALAGVIFLILRFRQNPADGRIFFLPLLMFVWVNLHGGFAVGLFFVGLFLGLEIMKSYLSWIFEKKKKGWLKKISQKIKERTLRVGSIVKLFFILLLSSLATLINPYGWKVYIEVATTIFDSYLKKNINEWSSVTLSNPMSYQLAIYVALLVILLLFSYKKIDWTYFLLTSVFFYLALESWRHIPLFLIVSTPLWVNIVRSIAGEELSLMVKRKYFLALMILAVFLTGWQQVRATFEISSSVEKVSESRYPLGAIRYLKENPIEGNMFNEYNWGGFVIWQYRERKVFIDGRMPSWRIGERSVFKDFNVIASLDEGWDTLLKDYDIAYSLVYDDPINQYKYGYLGWEKAYGDGFAAIYKRP